VFGLLQSTLFLDPDRREVGIVLPSSSEVNRREVLADTRRYVHNHQLGSISYADGDLVYQPLDNEPWDVPTIVERIHKMLQELLGQEYVVQFSFKDKFWRRDPEGTTWVQTDLDDALVAPNSFDSVEMEDEPAAPPRRSSRVKLMGRW
jgi:hypothetical protein